MTEVLRCSGAQVLGIGSEIALNLFLLGWKTAPSEPLENDDRPESDETKVKETTAERMVERKRGNVEIQSLV